jgi:hypothetical protein
MYLQGHLRGVDQLYTRFLWFVHVDVLMGNVRGEGCEVHSRLECTCYY